MRSFIPEIILASASLSVAFNVGEDSVHARNFQEPRSKQYRLVDRYSAQDFMDESKWSYYTHSNPTGGQTKYLSHAEAAKAGLAYVKNNQAVLAVDHKNNLPIGANRSSVRVTSTKAYGNGLVIADFAAMAHGCAVWPAYWTVGSGWPNGGELDIVEGVNLKTSNQYTLHTGPDSNCALKLNGGYTGTVLSTVCTSSKADNLGCRFLDTKATSFGHGFNMAGGGIFAHLRDSTGLKIWYIERDSIPQDIKDGKPNPSTWPTPVAFYQGCDFTSELSDHHLVINTAVGGQWADSDYPGSKCPSTIRDQIVKGKNFADAKWIINYIAVYQ